MASENTPNVEFSTTQMRKKADGSNTTWPSDRITLLQTHLIAIKLIIIWDKPEVSKFLLLTFFFPTVQIKKPINMLLKTNYKDSANLGIETILLAPTISSRNRKQDTLPLKKNCL